MVQLFALTSWLSNCLPYNIRPRNAEAESESDRGLADTFAASSSAKAWHFASTRSCVDSGTCQIMNELPMCASLCTIAQSSPRLKVAWAAGAQRDGPRSVLGLG